MNVEVSKRRAGTALVSVAAVWLLAACAPLREAPPETPAPIRYEEPMVVTLLSYYQQIQRYSGQELGRERTALAGQPISHANQVRLAMIYLHPRGPGDTSRALSLLESVLKANDPYAATLHPLARLLADQCQERLRNDAQTEKLNQQAREAQRRGDQLQEKLDALADIERSLPARSRLPRAQTGGQR